MILTPTYVLYFVSEFVCEDYDTEIQ